MYSTDKANPVKPELTLPAMLMRMLGVAVGQMFVYWRVKRTIRKKGGPDWAAYGFAKMAVMISGVSTQKMLQFKPEEIQAAIEYEVENGSNKNLVKRLVENKAK